MSSKDINKMILRCSAGCLRHVIGITYFRWNEGDPDEPEMYFETLHEPYEGFWGRLKHGLRYIFLREPMTSDSTLIGPDESMKLADACNDYVLEHTKWSAHMATAFEKKQNDS